MKNWFINLTSSVHLFRLWAEGQPDNWQSAVGSQEDCVEMVQDQGGAWNDLACSLRHDYICERDLNIGELKRRDPK